jgi:hypothetical protein
MPRIAALPEDHHLPLLQAVTDLVMMRETLQRELPAFSSGRLQLAHLNIKQLDYKPGKRCCVCYNLLVKESDTGNETRQLLLGVVEANGAAEAKYFKEKNEALFQPPFFEAVQWLPDLNMILWAFPNDPKIKGLPALFAQESLQELLQQHWQSLHIQPGLALREIDTMLVKYVPQRRCTLRHVLKFERPGDADAAEVVIYSKIHSPKKDNQPSFKLLQDVWSSPVCQSGRLLVPEPLFFDCGLNAIFQRGIQGRNLDELLYEIDLTDMAGKIGAMLAALQQSSIPGLGRRAPDYELQDCIAVKKRLGDISRVYETRLAYVDAELRKRQPHLTAVGQTPIHGAFRLTQLLLAEGKMAFIDFDDFSLGNPISDVGSFVAHLLYLPMKGVLSEAQSRAALRQFCHAYREQAPWGLPDDLLDWHTAAYLIGREAKKCQDKTNQISKRDYEGMIDKLLDLAAAILSGRFRLLK